MSNFVLRLVVPALMLPLVFILMRRRLQDRFPVFVVYCLSVIVFSVLRFLVRDHPRPYFIVYWSTEALELLLAFIAMLSVLRPLTEFEYVSHPWTRRLLVPVLAFIVLTALWTAVFNPIGKSAVGRFGSAMYVFVILMRLLEVLLFLASFRVKGRYPIKWTPYEFGILQGFGTLAFLTLLAYWGLILTLFHVRTTLQQQTFFQYFTVGAFFGAAVVWLIVFGKPEPPRREPPDDGTFLAALRVVQEQYRAQIEFVEKVAKDLGLRLTLVGQ